MTWQIVGVFRNILTASGKYPVRDFDNLPSPIEMELSLKPKTFFDCFVPFLTSTLNFKHFEKKADRNSFSISEITDYERLG